MLKSLLIIVLSVIGINLLVDQINTNLERQAVIDVRASDAFAKRHSVLLRAGGGSCSGVEIEAPSGKHYILTASHCRVLAFNGRIVVTLDSGITYKTRILDISTRSDLMLLEAKVPQTDAIRIADNVDLGAKIHTMTHGGGMPNYRTDGYLLAERPNQAPEFPLTTKGDERRCLIGRNRSIYEIFPGLQVCVMSVKNMATTARIVPGSSGGSILDEAGNLIGIASAMDANFSYVVSLDDIKLFLRAR